MPSFTSEEAEKFDLYSNESSKYLFYKFNNWIESLDAEKLFIRHTAKATNSYGLKKIEEKDRQILTEKIIHNVENENPYVTSTEEKPQIMEEIEKNYKICRRVYQSLFIDVTDTFH